MTPVPGDHTHEQFQHLLEASALFAQQQATLLNGTVTHGLTLTPVVDTRGYVRVAYGISRDDFAVPPLFPLTPTGAAPTGWIKASWGLTLDPEGEHLTVQWSNFAVWSSEDPDRDDDGFVRYEYERHTETDYPEAHLHVHGASRALEALWERRKAPTKGLKKLHFPVGSRRYRPCLEDVVEFLVVEGLAIGRDGWLDRVAESRDRFLESQLRAAVRRNPYAALEALNRACGTEFTLPPEGTWPARP